MVKKGQNKMVQCCESFWVIVIMNRVRRHGNVETMAHS